MRILMISDVAFPRINGVSTSIETFCRELALLGHEVTVLAPMYPGKSKPESCAGMIRIASRGIPSNPEDRLMRPQVLLRLIGSFGRQKFDLVHVQTPFVAHYCGVRAARQLNLPQIESYHTFFEEYFHHYFPVLPERLTRFLARRITLAQSRNVDALIAPSRAMRDALLRYGIQANVQVIPTGIDLDHFSKGDGERFRIRHGIPSDRPLLINIGRVAHEKNIDFLLRVVATVRKSVPGILLLIAGEGPARRHLESLAHRMDLDANTLFVDYLDRSNSLLDCYRAGDAFVFASRSETQGLVLLEAMAMGTPVISTAVLGTREILGPGRGALMAAEDVAVFSSTVLRLIGDPTLRSRLSREARDFAAEWSSRAMAERLVAFYAEILARFDRTQH